MIYAIETQYQGYRFRSRLEARWAVFFDALGVKYEYEPEGFDLGDLGLYLPDFFLPEVDGGYWIEVKGSRDACTTEVENKLIAVCAGTGCRGLIVDGEPYKSVEQGSFQAGGGASWWMFGPDGGGDFPYIFCLCPWCGKVGIEFDGRGARVCGWESHFEQYEDALAIVKAMGHHRADDKCYTGADPRIVRAAENARSARFEHGENGTRRHR